MFYNSNPTSRLVNIKLWIPYNREATTHPRPPNKMYGQKWILNKPNRAEIGGVWISGMGTLSTDFVKAFVSVLEIASAKSLSNSDLKVMKTWFKIAIDLIALINNRTVGRNQKRNRNYWWQWGSLWIKTASRIRKTNFFFISFTEYRRPSLYAVFLSSISSIYDPEMAFFLGPIL